MLQVLPSKKTHRCPLFYNIPFSLVIEILKRQTAYQHFYQRCGNAFAVHQANVNCRDAMQTVNVRNCLQTEGFLLLKPNITKAQQYREHNSSGQTDFHSAFKYNLSRSIYAHISLCTCQKSFKKFADTISCELNVFRQHYMRISITLNYLYLTGAAICMTHLSDLKCLDKCGKFLKSAIILNSRPLNTLSFLAEKVNSHMLQISYFYSCESF